MNLMFPVILEQVVARSDDPDVTTDRVHASDDFNFVEAGGVQMSVSGRDSSAENNGRGITLTNLCGIHHGELWKVCPPYCKQVKPMSGYGDGGRTTDQYRDQSNCTECRGRYRLNVPRDQRDFDLKAFCEVAASDLFLRMEPGMCD